MRGVDADKWVIHKRGYDIVPEVIDVSIADIIKENNKEIERTTKGWNKSKSMRKIGTVPFSLMYNYAYAQGATNDRIHEFYAENKGENMLKLLNEFPSFRLGDKRL